MTMTKQETLQQIRTNGLIAVLRGPSYIKNLHGPFPQIPLMPTGGVSADNVAQWLQAGAVAVGAGGELCPSALAKSRQFDKITEIARHFVAAVKAAREA